MAVILTMPHFPGNPSLHRLGPQNVLLTSRTVLLLPVLVLLCVMGTKTRDGLTNSPDPSALSLLSLPQAGMPLSSL